MYQLGLLAFLFLAFGYLSMTNFDNAAIDAKVTQASFLSGHVRAYAGFVSGYARANPAASGAVSDAVIGMPTWFKRAPSLHGHVVGGKAIVFTDSMSQAAAFAAAWDVGGGLLCGVTRNGALVRPGGEVVSLVLPASVPDNGSLVLIL